MSPSSCVEHSSWLMSALSRGFVTRRTQVGRIGPLLAPPYDVAAADGPIERFSIARIEHVDLDGACRSPCLTRRRSICSGSPRESWRRMSGQRSTPISMSSRMPAASRDAAPAYSRGFGLRIGSGGLCCRMRRRIQARGRSGTAAPAGREREPESAVLPVSGSRAGGKRCRLGSSGPGGRVGAGPRRGEAQGRSRCRLPPGNRWLGALLPVPNHLLVADGHHRYEAALAYRDEMRRPSTPASMGRGNTCWRCWPRRLSRASSLNQLIGVLAGGDDLNAEDFVGGFCGAGFRLARG